MYRYWRRKTDTETEEKDFQRFLRSLKGWSETNYGANLYPLLDTCEWFKQDDVYKDWLSDPQCGTLFYLGSPGLGKSHLARSLFKHLHAAQRRDLVMSFHCSSFEHSPAIWDYFTWKLLTTWPHWFTYVPPQHRCRDERSPPLGVGGFVEIWTAFRRACSERQIFLIVDGLEQAPAGSFESFFDVIEQLRQPMLADLVPSLAGQPMGGPTKIKLIVVSRINDVTDAASITTSRSAVAAEAVVKDVVLYLDNKFSIMGSTRATPDNEELDKVKEAIKNAAEVYWPYATFAIDDVEKAVTLRSSLKPFLEKDYIPTGLTHSIDSLILPILQSVNNDDRYIRTAINVIISIDVEISISIRQLKSILECLYGHQVPATTELAELIQRRCGDLFWITAPDGIVLSVHSLVTAHLSSYLPLEQRQTNMAFFCLKYLLQDKWCEPLPLSRNDTERNTKWMAKEAPFYGFAALRWPLYLPKLEELDPQLVLLLRTFLSPECPQYHTWHKWRSVFHADRTDLEEPPAIFLLREGCINVVKQLWPAQPLPVSRPSFFMSGLDSLRQLRLPEKFHNDTVAVPEWLSMTGVDGQTALMAAAMSADVSLVESVLKWPIDINARAHGGRTVLMVCLTSQRLMELEGPEADDVAAIISLLLVYGADPNISDHHGITPLHVACMRGKLKLVRLLLEFGALIDIADAWTDTPLEKAYSSGNTELVEELVRCGADLDVWMPGGEQPLTRCIFDDNIDMFRIFLRFANVNEQTVLGFSPIHIACDSPNRLEFLRLLITRPDLDLDAIATSWPETIDRQAMNALCFALRHRNYSAVQMLLQAGASPCSFPKLGVLPLAEAVLTKDKSMVELLLAYGAPVNDFNNRFYCKTALGYAADTGADDIVRLLIDHGADPTVEEGFAAASPLHIALTAKINSKMVQYLLEAPIPANVDYSAKKERHPLLSAVKQGDADTVRLMLNHKADIGMWLQPAVRPSPLHVAAKAGRVDLCEIILEYEPKLLDIQFEKGLMCESPLFKACQNGQSKAVRFLLDKGAKKDIISFHYNESILIGACENGDLETVKAVLSSAPELVNVPADNGCTPLFLSCRNGDVEAVRLLLEAGANIAHKNWYGWTCVSDLFRSLDCKRQKMLKLLIKHGLDINQVNSSTGLSVLGVAIAEGSTRDVKWLLEQGADPFRCQRGPGPEESWRNALQVTSRTQGGQTVSIMELLLEPQWGLREHLTDKDWQGATVLPMMPPTRMTTQLAARLISVCDDIAAQTGQDLYPTLMLQPAINGLSSLDYACGHLVATPSSIAQLNKTIVARAEMLLSGHRCLIENDDLIEDITNLLITRGGFDLEATVLLDMMLTRPHVRWDDDGYSQGAIGIATCGDCDAFIDEAYHFCRFCQTVRCHKCRDNLDVRALHKHVWLDLDLKVGVDVNGPEIQMLLERVHEELSVEILNQQPPPQTELENMDKDITTNEASQTSVETIIPQPTFPHQIPGSLSLATLHAFNYLAIRRPAWSPYLALSHPTHAQIAPWETQPGYSRRRMIIERRIMRLEMSPWRRITELEHLQQWGLRTAYADEDATRRDLVWQDAKAMFNEYERQYVIMTKENEEVKVRSLGNRTGGGVRKGGLEKRP